MANIPKEFINKKKTMRLLCLKIGMFYNFVAQKLFVAFTPTNPGKKTNKGILVYHTSAVLPGTSSTGNDKDELITAEEAIALLPFGRITFFRKFIPINTIRRINPVDPNAKPISGQFQRYWKRNIINAINFSRLSCN